MSKDKRPQPKPNTTDKAADTCKNSHAANNGTCGVAWCAYSWQRNKP